MNKNRLERMITSLINLGVAASVVAAVLFFPAVSFGGNSCSYDQGRVFRQETPYPLMVDASNTATFGATIAAWATENTSGMHNPGWTLLWVFAAATGHLEGPDCREIPAAYFDDVAIAEEKTALPLDRDTHVRILKKFARVHLINLAIIGVALYDTENPIARTALGAAAISPLIAYGLHEWWRISNKKRWKDSVEQASFGLEPTFTTVPEPIEGSTHLRFVLGLKFALPAN